MKFCSECGSKVSLQFVSNDDRQRLVCDDCGTTHYQNQNVLVAVYVCVEDEILWIRRGIVPAVGLWAIPGGYMERGETPEKAVSRELLEETPPLVEATHPLHQQGLGREIDDVSTTYSAEQDLEVALAPGQQAVDGLGPR